MKKTKKGKVRQIFWHFSLAMAIVWAVAGCQPNQKILNSSGNEKVSPPTPAATLAPRKTSFEQDLQEMEDAGFDYIFVVRRKDGGVFTDEDRQYLRENMPMEINRRVSSDDGKAFIFGSGFAIAVEDIEKWKKRFHVEDLSKQKKDESNKANTNQ
jgi:hypothetical protein